MKLWDLVVAFLVWLSADPQAIDLEAPRAAAAVAAARASMLADSPAPPGPTPPAPKACDCGETCVRGKWKPDGRIEQACRCECRRCQAERAKTCVSGTCKVLP